MDSRPYRNGDRYGDSSWNGDAKLFAPPQHDSAPGDDVDAILGDIFIGELENCSQEVVGSEGIPRDLRGLSASTLADLAANLNPCPAEYVGFGFFPIAPSDQEVPYDKVKQGRTVVMTDSGPMYSYNLRDKEDSEYPYQTPEEALVVLTQHLDSLTSQIQSPLWIPSWTWKSTKWRQQLGSLEVSGANRILTF